MYVERQLDMTLLGDDACCCPICGDHWVIIDGGVGECGSLDCQAKWIYTVAITDYGKKNQVHEPIKNEVEEEEIDRFELMEMDE